MGKVLPIIVSANSDIDGYILYPDELGNGVVLSEQERLDLYQHYVKIYSKITHSIQSQYQKKIKCDPNIAEAIVRHSVIPLLSTFFNVSIRVMRAIDTQDSNLLSIKLPDIKTPISIEQFSSLAKSDPNFNQFLIYFVGTIWGLKEIDTSLKYAEQGTHKDSFVNHNSRLYRRTILNGIFYRLKKIFYRIRSSILRQNCISFGLSTVRSAFSLKSVQCYIKNIQFNWNIDEKPCNKEIRELIFDYELVDVNQLDNLLDMLNLGVKYRDKYKSCLVDFLRYFYPVYSLEMFSEFIKLSEKNLNVYPSACMIAVGGLDTKLCYLSSLAKSQGRRVIKLQHGGYMGYHKLGYYKNQIWTKEFNDCDYYLTWGWGLPDELNLGKTKFIEFVSPWLSERKQYWKNIKLYQYKDYKFDVLLAPTRLSSFNSVSWVNSIDDVFSRSSALVSIVHNLTNSKISVLYKSPGLNSSKTYRKSIDEMVKSGGKYFTILNDIDKGLDIELISQVSIILWDVIGTGFLECLACGIPAIVFLPSYLLIEDNMIGILCELEEVGVVHTTVETIPNTLCSYRNNPKSWMLNNNRKIVVEKFTNMYCKTGDNWNDDLINYLKQ